MATSKGMNVSGNYVVHHKLFFFHLCTLYLKQSNGRTKSLLLYVVVAVFFTLTDRASTIPSNIRGC